MWKLKDGRASRSIDSETKVYVHACMIYGQHLFHLLVPKTNNAIIHLRLELRNIFY